MALIVRQNGKVVSGQANNITASWFNDYHDLLTGVMNDQPVYLLYKPGSATGNPTLKLGTDGNNPLLQAYNSAGTQVYEIDQSGNVTATSFTGTVAASNISGTVANATNAANVGTNRNGTTTDVPIYTGTTTPSSPPTGSIWVKA